MQLSKEGVIHEIEAKEQTIILRTNNNIEKDAEEITNGTTLYKLEIVWSNVFVYIIFHCMAIYVFYLGFTAAKWGTIAWGK